MSDDERGLGLMLVIIANGLILGFGLAISNIVRPEIVFDFLQFNDLGLVFVMSGTVVVTDTVFILTETFDDCVPLAGRDYGRQLKSFGKDVVVGGVVPGAGWSISGICPDAVCASLNVGNYPILIVIGGVFVDAYLQGLWHARHTENATTGTSAG